MKTVFKILIACIVGLATMWFCYQVFNLEQIMTTVAAVIATTVAATICDKILQRRN